VELINEPSDIRCQSNPSLSPKQALPPSPFEQYANVPAGSVRDSNCAVDLAVSPNAYSTVVIPDPGDKVIFVVPADVRELGISPAGILPPAPNDAIPSLADLDAIIAFNATTALYISGLANRGLSASLSKLFVVCVFGQVMVFSLIY
jgi:hypothetical protein